MFGIIAGICAIGSAIGGALSAGCAAIGSCLAGIGGAIASGVAALSGAIGTLATGFAHLASTIGTTLSTIGSQVCTAIRTFIAQFPKMDIKQLIELVDNAFKIIDAVMKVLFPKQEMPQEEIGARAMQHPEIKREDYDSTEAYLEALKKTNYKPGAPEGVNQKGWKFACRSLGAGIQMRAISEKVKVAAPMDFYLDCAKTGLAAKDVLDGKGGGLLEVMHEKGIGDASQFTITMRGDADFAESPHGDNSLDSALRDWKSPETGMDLPLLKEQYAK